jgi:D-alanyl-D-alanine carboxypeptidase/D-alanyl-D-alanine-endopeptidase (penicillin-binding protein 4)
MTGVKRSLRRLVPGLSALLVAACTVTAGSRPSPARTPAEALRLAIDSLVNDRRFANGHIGLLVVNPRTGDTLYSRNAGKLFMPASNQKILTAAVSLVELGPDYRFRTAIASHGNLQNGVLGGDLVIIGRGDPSLSDRARGSAMNAMLAIADSLSARGVRSITGSVRPGGNVFPGDIYGYGWELDDLTSSGTPTDELLFNEGMVRTIKHTPRGDTVELIGTANPTVAYLAALDTALRARGITTGLGVSDSILDVGEPLDTLYAFDSPPLREILKTFLKPSQNQIGEILLKTLGLEKAGAGIPDSGAAIITRQLREWGVDSTAAVVYDGSGLSRHDLITPEAIVKVLVAMQRHPSFQVFYDALPIGGVDGTISNRMRGTPAEKNVHAKTGTLEFVRSLSGYVTTADNETLIFSFLSNHFTTPVSAISAVQDSVADRLARYHSRPSR